MYRGLLCRKEWPIASSVTAMALAIALAISDAALFSAGFTLMLEFRLGNSSSIFPFAFGSPLSARFGALGLAGDRTATSRPATVRGLAGM